MKTFMAVTKCLFLFCGFLALQSMAVTDGVEGVWTYEATGTPPEYSKGEITITRTDDAYQLVLTIGQMSIDADKVKVEGQQVDFSLYIEDSKIDVSLTIDGDTLTGKAESYDGTFPLKGKRK